MANIIKVGANGYSFVKLDFEIALINKLEPVTEPLRGPGPQPPIVPTGQPRPYLVMRNVWGKLLNILALLSFKRESFSSKKL